MRFMKTRRINYLILLIFLYPSLSLSLDIDTIELQQKQAEQHSELSSSEKSQLQALYEQAKSYLSQEQQYLAQAKAYQDTIKQAPKKIKQLKKNLRKQTKKILSSRKKLEKFKYAQLKQQLLDKKSQLSNLKLDYDELSQNLNQAKHSLPETSALLLSQNNALEGLAKQMEKASPATETQDQAVFLSYLKAAEKLMTRAEYRATAAHIKQLHQNKLSHDYRVNLLGLRLELLQQQIQWLESEIVLQQQVLNSKQEQVAEQLETALEKQQQAQHNKTTIEQKALDFNQQLSDTLSHLTQQISQKTATKQYQQNILQQLEYDFDALQQQFEITGLNKNLAAVLYQQKKKLPALHRYQQKDRQVWQQELVNSRLAQYQLNLQQQTLVSVKKITQELLQQAQQENQHIDIKKTQAHLKQLIEHRQELFNQLSSIYAQYIKLLYELDSEYQLLFNLSKKYTVLLDEKLFWVPNLNPVDWSWFGAFSTAPLPFGNQQDWQQTYTNLRQQHLTDALSFWMLSLLFMSSLLFRLLIYRSLLQQCKYVGNVLRDNFFYTIKAILLSFFLALPWILTINGLAWGLLQTDEKSFSHALGDALFYAGMVFFLVEFLRFLAIENGVLHRHFHWEKKHCDNLYYNLSWFQLLIFPLLIIINLNQSLSYLVDNLPIQQTWGRLALISSCIAILFFLNRILTKGLKANVWLKLLIIASTISPIILALNGYYYTSLNIGIHLFHTSGIIMASLLLYYLVARWLVLMERQLGFQQALAQQRKRYSDKTDRLAVDENSMELPEVNINSIGEQAHALLRLIVFSFFITALWLIWADITPVLTILHDVVLWETTNTVDEVSQTLPVTLYDLSFTLVALAVTFIAAWNLPGMLELVLLQRLSLPADKRYTIVTITKYIIVVTGVLMSAHALGLRWSQVQWLAAALSVGLGFGLQEIFANFVSGLIILFERPIRIGDMVTVGEINGEVSSIHMRTTIIRDRDNKELIVPNKSFITNELINWSLTDPNIRVKIPVGVAYGSDIELVQRLLYEVVKTESLVLPQYPPKVFFLNFGDSSLDFEIRVYVADYPHQNMVRHSINSKINAAFTEHGIEIPFPQRDVHLYPQAQTGSEAE